MKALVVFVVNMLFVAGVCFAVAFLTANAIWSYHALCGPMDSWGHSQMVCAARIWGWWMFSMLVVGWMVVSRLVDIATDVLDYLCDVSEDAND